MEDIILAYLGPLAGIVMTLAFLLVLLLHKFIRKRHIVWLLITTVLSFVGFFAYLLWALATYDGRQPQWLYTVPLTFLAALGVGCGTSIGFAFILKFFGIATLEDEPPRSRGRK